MNLDRYVVQPGDSVYKIAKAHGVSMAAIVQLNNLQHPERIFPGQILLIPGPDGVEPGPVEIPEPYFTYAAWLFEAYAGKDSELSAVTTYLYQAVVLDRPEFDALLRPIAFDELNHLEQLGRALRHLGVDPRYGSFRSGHWVDWRANFVNYTADLCALLEADMEDELKACREYLELAQRIPIPEIQAILTQIAADEDRHYHCFLDAKNQFCCEVPPMPPPEAPVLEGPPEAGGAG